MKHHDQTESQLSSKKPWYNKGWIWLITAVIGIGVIYFGFSGLTEQMTEVNQSIQDNTVAIREQTSILTEIENGIQQLIIEIKDSVNSIMQSK